MRNIKMEVRCKAGKLEKWDQGNIIHDNLKCWETRLSKARSKKNLILKRINFFFIIYIYIYIYEISEFFFSKKLIEFKKKKSKIYLLSSAIKDI